MSHTFCVFRELSEHSRTVRKRRQVSVRMFLVSRMSIVWPGVGAYLVADIEHDLNVSVIHTRAVVFDLESQNERLVKIKIN